LGTSVALRLGLLGALANADFSALDNPS